MISLIFYFFVIFVMNVMKNIILVNKTGVML